jgi:hypothetical protein
MKRYAITIALVLLIAASLGTYYAFGADLRLPEYRLQTIEGDQADAAELTLFGSYVGGKGSYSIEVSTEGSKRSESSTWSRLQESDGPLSSQPYSDFHSLYQEHAGFMRGKLDTYGFYRDQDTLIFAKATYAKVKDSQQDGTILWTVDALDLASGKQTHYADEQIEPANYAHVIDVQENGTEVHVLTSVGRSDLNVAMIDKVFDSVSGELIRTVQLPLGESARSDHELRIEIIAEEKPTAANPRVLFIVREQSKNSTDTTAMASDQPLVTFSEHLYVYHYASGAVKEVPLAAGADENKEVTSTVHNLEEDTFTTLQVADEAVTIDRYDLSAGQAHPQVTIKANQLGKGRISQAQALNGRIYLLLQTGDTLKHNSMPITAVADATDGHILYKGTPAIVKSNGRPDDQLDDVWLLNMKIRR